MELNDRLNFELNSSRPCQVDKQNSIKKRLKTIQQKTANGFNNYKEIR